MDVMYTHQASDGSEGHGSDQKHHQDQICGTPDQLHALSLLGLWGEDNTMWSMEMEVVASEHTLNLTSMTPVFLQSRMCVSTGF